MGNRTADATAPDSRMRDVEALRGPLDPDAALRRLTEAPRFERQVVLLVRDVLNALDRLLDAPIEERLAVVAAHSSECVDAAAWRVSRVDDGAVRPTRVEVLRRPDLGSDCVLLEGATGYQSSGRPCVAEAAEGSAFSETLNTGDAVERGALRAIGVTSALVAGGYDPDAHQWLLELFSDEFTHETPVFTAIVFSLVQAALGFPRAATPPRATR